MPDAVLESLVLLATLILTSLLDVIALNFLLQSKNPRSHNKLRLINDCLARHQFAYPIWYITVILLADFHKLDPHEALIVRSWMTPATILSVLFWLGGLYGVAGQDDAIRDDHDCNLHNPSYRCPTSSVRLRTLVVALNSSLAGVSLAIALIFVNQPAVIKALTK